MKKKKTRIKTMKEGISDKQMKPLCIQKCLYAVYLDLSLSFFSFFVFTYNKRHVSEAKIQQKQQKPKSYIWSVYNLLRHTIH